MLIYIFRYHDTTESIDLLLRRFEGQEGDRLVIWFVCQHKSVSRFAKLIDDSKNRASRQQLPDSFISEMQDGYVHHNTIFDTSRVYDGSLKELIFFDSVLSETDRRAIESRAIRRHRAILRPCSREYREPFLVE